MDEVKPVNLPLTIPDFISEYKDAYTPGASEVSKAPDYMSVFNTLLAQGNPPKDSPSFPMVPTADINMSGRYPLYYPGRDDEEMYAQSQTGMQKAVNGIVKMAGTAVSTFINGTAGLVYGIDHYGKTGEIKSIWNNPLSNALNNWNNKWEDKYAHYETIRERNGSWWEPANLFTGNFLWNGVVKNLGFSLGAFASGFAWSGLFKAVGLTGKLMSMGTDMGSKAESAIGESISLPQAERMGSITSKLDEIWNSAKPLIGKGLRNIDRAVVATFGTVGEGSIEAINNAQQFRQQMIDDFTKSHGYTPSGEDLNVIDHYADKVGNWSLWLNVPLLTATNYIQLPKIWSTTFKGEKQILNGVARREGKYISTLPEKGFGKLFYKSRNLASLFFNTTEGFEEGAQYAIQTGTQKYFEKKMKGQTPSELDDGLLYGIQQALFTDEGTLNIFLGGFSGALQTSGVHTLGRTGKIGERGVFGYGGEEGKYRGEAIDAFNTSLIKDKLKDAYSNLKVSELTQQERQDLVRQGDILESKDLESDFAHTFIDSRLKYNAKGFIDEEINSVREEASSDAGFLKLQQEGYAAPTDTKETFLNRLSNLQEHANNTAKLKDELDLKYKGVVDKDGKPVYSQVVLDKMLYAGAKVMDYNRRISDLGLSLTKEGINTQSIIDEIMKGGDITEETKDNTKNIIDSKTGINIDERTRIYTDLRDLTELSLRKKMFLEEYDDIKKNPKKYDEVKAEVVPETPEGEKKETIKVKTRIGEKEIEIGTEYYLGRVVEYDKEGHEVYRAPRLTILGENEDGTIRIKDHNGNIKDVAKSVLEDYNLGKVSTVQSNPNARWFLRHWNDVVWWNVGKGKKIEGRIEHNPDTNQLYFVYKSKGKKGYTIRHLPITTENFEPKKGYTEGVFTHGRTLTAEDSRDIKDNKEALKTPEKAVIYELNTREGTRQVVSDLYEDLRDKHEKTNKLIEQKKNDVKLIEEDIADLTKRIESAKTPTRETKKGIRFKPTIRKFIEAANRLSRAKDDIEQEIKDLEAENERTESVLSYIQDAIENVKELPIDVKEILYELGYEVELLKETVEDTTKQISALTRLMDGVEKALDSAVDFLRDLINQFKRIYPKVPARIGQEWVDFLKANPNFLKNKPTYADDINELEKIVAQVEDEDITPNEEILNELNPQLENLKSSLKQAEDELRAKMLLLDRFQKAYDNYKKADIEKRNIKNNPQLIKDAVGTADRKNVHTKNTDEDERYESVARKATDIIWRATMGVMRPNKPHTIRANKFGFNLEKLKNRNNIRGVYVTSKNEGALGLTGLMEHLEREALIEDSNVKVDKDNIIALVMVDISGESPVLIDENGEAIKGDSINSSIYQVLPNEELKWSEKYGGESMFRKGTPEEHIQDILEYYKDFRKKVFETTDLQDSVEKIPFHTIGASFGFPMFNEKLDSEGNTIKNERTGKAVIDYNTRTSVEDAGLISEEELLGDPLIMIPKTNEIVGQGTTQFNNPLGRPFLQLPNGLLPLQNRHHTKEEANTIFNVILQLARNMSDPSIGLMDKTTGRLNEKNKRLVSWLESVVYWGIPETREGERKPGAYNNIFWEKNAEGDFVLVISGKGMTFPFTPRGLEENKGTIVDMLEKMFNNINSYKVENTSDTYEEILSVDIYGEPVVKKWANYQTYLLSKVDPDGKARKDIPLTTVMVPLGEEPNRTAIYFYTEDNAGEVKLREVSPKTKIIAGGLKFASKKFNLDGTTPNTIPRPQEDGTIKNLVFRATSAEDIQVDPKDGDNLFILQKSKKMLRDIAENRGEELTDEEALEEARKAIKMFIAKEIGTTAAKEEVKPTKEEYEEFVEKGTVSPEIIDSIADKIKKGDILNDEEKAIFAANTSAINDKLRDIKRREDSEDDYARIVVERQAEEFEKEDWPKVERWLKANFPNVPVYRVKNIIKATNGRQAWGMFKDGAIYVYENAEVGTVYHEVFEGVWKMFSSPEEQKSIIDEFKQRKGSFIDRPSGKSISYSEATDQQIKEQLAEEFRDYVQYKKIPAKPEKGRPFILKLFSDIITFIKEMFFGIDAESKVEEMFSNINKGSYKGIIPYASQLTLAKQGVIDIDEAFATTDDQLREAIISDSNRRDIIQSMTFYALSDLIEKDENLFNLEDHIKKNGKEIYGSLLSKILSDISSYSDLDNLSANVVLQWDSIVNRHKEYLRSYNIEFDENDNLQLKEEDKIRESDYVDANKVDHLRKMNTAMKMLLSTLPVVNNETGRWERSTVGGPRLLSLGKVNVSLLNKLHSSTSVEDMIYNLREMAKDDASYRRLYKRLTKKDYSQEITKKGADFSNIKTEHGSRLLSAFYSYFKKQNPEVKTITVFDNGEIAVGDTHLSTFASQIKEDYINNIILKARSGEGHFIYDNKKRAYVGNPSSISSIKLDTPEARVKFLEKIGISFDLRKVKTLTGKSLSIFNEAVDGIRESISKGGDIVSFSGRVLSIHNRLMELGYIQAALNNPEFDSTFFNINNERTQSFIGTNPVSDLYDFLSSVEWFDDNNIIGTQYGYLKTDSFSQGSNILKRMFAPNGKKNTSKESEGLLRVVYISGTDNMQRGRRKQSSKLSYKERLVQELNLNIAGYYLNLVPGDATMEWAINMGNPISEESIRKGKGDINDIFRDYFIAELNLAREADMRKSTMGKLPNGKNRDAGEMRFFKSILGEALHNKVIAAKEDATVVYDNNKTSIDSAVSRFINQQNENLKNILLQYGILEKTEKGYSFENVKSEDNLSEEELATKLTFLNVNYNIANIELHKILYADPYQYTDELKRIKNFLSPRQPLISNSPKMNALFNRVWNKDFKKGDSGWTNFMQDYFKSSTLQDIYGIMKDLVGYDSPWKETDGGGIISFKGYRQFRIRIGNWNDSEERQYKHDMAYEDMRSQGASAKVLEEFNKQNPGIQSAYTPIKPSVAGNKGNGDSFNNIIVDKFALYPISRRLLDDINRAGGKSSSNAISLYEKMNKQNIDYVVFESGRKVGAVNSQPVYNSEGSFNSSAFSEDSIINIPFAIMSVQTDVPSKEESIVTRGTQVTKLITMDYMEAGIPVDFEVESDISSRYRDWYKLTEDQKNNTSPLYKEIKDNQKLLEALIDVGYQNVLTQLGIEEKYNSTTKKKEYSIRDLSLAARTLRSEILKREINDNISDALNSFLKGVSVLEATPAYHQIRNILYSIADREVMSQKINGGMKVQIPSSLLESVKAKEIDINGKKGFVSDTLDFYKKDGKQVCEIMVGRWFDSDMSDEELLNYLNNTEEGKKILSGLAFRIPTQRQNSIESFVIKQFLPKEFKDSVVIPSALVVKTGGDFDIDKLTVYLKNVMSVNGKPKYIPYLGIGEEAKTKLGEMFATPKEMEYIQELLEKRTPEEAFADAIFKKIVGEDEYEQMLIEGYLSNNTKPEFRKWWVDRLYRKSLQNGYIESSQRLVSNSLNFERLTKPNSADQLKELGKFIAEKTKGSSFDYTEVGNMLDRGFMSKLRHAFVTGKYAIGIAAVNQTNHSLNQRQLIYIDTSNIKNLKDEDIYWLGDGKIKFDRFNEITVEGKGKVVTLSMIRNAEKTVRFPNGQDISDIISQFIDGYVDISKGPWIMELGAAPNVVSTWFFLIKAGIPINTVAYFMNQPIIRDYLHSIESAGYSWLFMSNFVTDMMDIYNPQAQMIEETKIPSEQALKDMIGKKTRELTNSQKNQQQFILNEFLKYAKMAEHMFYVTQGSNFDTANFNDPLLVFKKFKQLEKAQNSIISSVDDLLANSFIGKLSETVKDIRNSLATILKSDQKRVRDIIHRVLEPYVDMNDRDFIKLAQKAVNDLFDYAVQTDQKLNEHIKNILIDRGGVTKQLETLMNEVRRDPLHPLYGNHIIGKDGILQLLPSDKASGDSVNNIKLKALQNKVYDQNNIIYAFREIKDFLKDKSNLYDRIVELAILQSGLSSSSRSFTSVIPYEDFEKQYHSTLMKLASLDDLERFATLNVFQRENWNNDDVTPHMRASWIPTVEGLRYNPAMAFMRWDIKDAVKKRVIPPVINVRQNTKEANFKHVVYTWEKYEELNTPENEKRYGLKGKALIQKVKSEMRKIGDYSYINKGLFERVEDKYGNPLETSYVNKRGETVKQYVYKAINAWGDGQRANEFYNVEKKSVIDNGFVKVEGVDNSKMIALFQSNKITETPEVKTTPTSEGINISSYESGLGGRLSNFASIPVVFEGKKYSSSEQAYQANKKGLSDEEVKSLMTKIITAKLTQHPELIEEIRNRGGIDFLNNSTHNLIKEGREVKSDRWTGKEGLFMQSLREAFKATLPQEGIISQLEGVSASTASTATLQRVREAIKKMGIDVQSLSDYLKGNPNVNIKGVNALADLTRGIIAIAEGKEDVALTEEMVHIATAILEQTNPKMVTEMISKIANFKIYQQVYDAYKDNPAYQLPNSKPDIRKIKKEAVDKLISELIINQNEGSTEFPELMEEVNKSVVRTWWQRVLDWIRSLYKKSNISIFEEAAKTIIEGEVGEAKLAGEGVFFQYSDVQKRVQQRLADTGNTIRKVEGKEAAYPFLLETEEANNWYEKQDNEGVWKRIEKRVTDRVKQWYRQRFPGKTFSPEEKAFNEFKRKEGIKGHKYFEEIHNRFFNKDGTRLDKALPRPYIADAVDREIYNKLEGYYIDLINNFSKDGKTPLVFSEVIVYDPKEKEAGTIDLLIVDEKGRANIIDWKFMSVGANAMDIAWYKQGAYNIQLGRYKEMLIKNYGIKDIGMNRAIPILFNIQYADKRIVGSKDKITGIAVGTVDTSKIEKLTLLPVSEETESTETLFEGAPEYKILDKMIDKLNSIYRQLAKKNVKSDEEREYKRERLNVLRRAVRMAQGSLNLSPLIDVIKVMRKEGDEIVNDWKSIYKDRHTDYKEFTNRQLSDFSESLSEYIIIGKVFSEIDHLIGKLIYTPAMEAEAKSEEEKTELAYRKDMLDKIKEEASQIRDSQREIEDIAGLFEDKFVGQRNLVRGLLEPKAVVKGLFSSFAGVSDLPLPSLQVLEKIVSNAKDKASQVALEEVDRIMEIRKRLAERGGSLKELVQRIYQKDNKDKLINKLVYKYAKEFYDKIDSNAAEGARDKQWLKDNIDIEAYKKEAGEILKSKIEWYNKIYDENTELRDSLIAQERRKWDIEDPFFDGWNNYIIKRHPLAKWESAEYKEIQKDKDLFDLYNFIHEINEKAAEVGYITNRVHSTFLPFVRKGFAESLAWDFSLSAIKNWGKNLTVRAGDVGYGGVNEFTGEYEYGIPKYFTYDFTRGEDGVNDYSDVSEDIFKNMIVYINHMERYKYLSDVEGQLQLVKDIESFKDHIATNNVGDIVFKEGTNIPETITGNKENTELFDLFLRALLYEQKYPLSDTDVPLGFGKAINFVKEQVNKIAGREVWTVNDKPSATSLMKSVDAVNRAMQLKTLGFEFISGAVNWFGNNIQVATQAGHYFTENEIIKNEMLLLGNRFRSEDERNMYIQLVDRFMPLKDDPTYEKLKKAGMSAATKGSITDFLMMFMRKPEELVEKTIFYTLTQNMMIEDGKIISIREYVKNKYPERYESGRYKEISKKIEDEIEELKKTRSIDATKRLVNGKLDIPGLDMNDESEFQRLTNLTRRIARNATGALTASAVNKMSMNVWTKSMMVFKNWIPTLLITRFGSFRKISDDFSVRIDEDGVTEGEKYDIGRVRLFGSFLSLNIIKMTSDIINVLEVNDKGLLRLDELYEKYSEQYKRKTGEDLQMSREDFNDLIRTNLSNQIKELGMLLSLLGATLAIGYMAPDDDKNKSAKNFFRFSQRVVDKFVTELSFFYNPAEFQKLLSGGTFPAIGLTTDILRFMKHFSMEVTGYDLSNPTLTEEEVRKKAQPIKNLAKIFPFTKSAITYGAILNEDFAKEFDVTIQNQGSRR